VNYLAGDVSPNAVLSGVGAGGAVCIYSMAATDVIVDVNGYVTGGGTGGGPTPNTEVDGLKFDIDGAAGLGLAEQAVSSNTLGSRGSRLADGSGSSNLLAVEPDGSMRPAIDVGSVHIEHLQIGPDDKVYAVIATEPGECILIVIDSDTGVATCVDDTLMVVDIAEDGTFVQFDEAGGVYYKGYDMDSPMPLIRRNDDGVITDYVNDNQWIDDWLVTSDAAIFLRGQTLSTSASWLRRVSPTGGLATIVNGYVPFMHVFPDGNVYFGVHNDPIGVRRFNVAMGSLDPVNYIGPACDDPCAAPVFAVNDPTPYAENGEWGFTSDGRVFSGTDYATPRQLFPAPLEVATQVEKTQRLLGLSSTLLISGTDALDRNILTEIDPADGTEAVLIDPDVVGEVEVYHLGYNETENKVIFDGLRFSDNKYVVGFIDPQTGEVVTTPAPGGKLVDLQAFS